jgi:RNA polymerase sigma-70 factor, ECF subfamily
MGVLGSGGLGMASESQHTDAMLVGRAQAGDREAFAELFRRHYPLVLRACSRRLSSDAEELAQAAFVRAFERIDQCTGEQRFGGWVQVIARHLCTDTARARARADAYARAAASRRSTSDANWPEEHALRRERMEVLTGVLRDLPRRQREVLVAREIEGRRPTEIAAALGVSLGAVDSLLLRARRAAAAGYRTMAAEQGTASVASTAVAAMAAGGAAAGPPTVWRVVRRGAEAVWGAAVRFGAVTAGSVGHQLVAGTAVVVALAGPVAGTAHPAAAPAGRAPTAGLTLPSPGGTRPSVPERIVVPAPVSPTPPVSPVAPTPPASLGAPGRPAPPVTTPPAPNPLGSIFDLLESDADAAFDRAAFPQVAEAPGLGATAREAWRAGRDAVTEAGTIGWRTGRELVEASRSQAPFEEG